MSTEKAVAQEYYVIVKTFGAPSPEASDAAAILGVCEGVNCIEDVLRRLKAISDGAASGGSSSEVRHASSAPPFGTAPSEF